jgi:hypothetical protein
MDYTLVEKALTAQCHAINARDREFRLERCSANDVESDVAVILAQSGDIVDTSLKVMKSKLAQKRLEFQKAHDVSEFVESQLHSKFQGLQRCSHITHPSCHASDPVSQTASNSISLLPRRALPMPPQGTIRLSSDKYAPRPSTCTNETSET